MEYTIKDVARIAGVSVATASMALNAKPGLRKETREKVLETAAKLNYTPNASARSLIMRHSGTIGLVVTDITNPFFGMLTAEINKAVIASGYSLSIAVSGDDPGIEAKSVRRFMEERAEGILMVPSAASEYDLSHLFSLKSAEIPFVFVTTMYPGIKADCVMCDLKKGSFLLTEHLLNMGHRKIVMLSGSRSAIFSSERIDGCKEAYAKAGLQFHDDWIIETTPNYDGGYFAAEKAISLKPDAIITVNDHMALGAIKRLKNVGLTVPGDISVAGYDDLLYASLLETPLTTVRQPIADLAVRSVEILLGRMQKEAEEPSTFFVDPLLKIRETTK